MSANDPVLRPAARVLLIDAAERVLLFRHRNPTTGASVWATPGGAIEPGESPEAAARRELAEETGLKVISLRGPVWHREHVVEWEDRHYRQQEVFFAARVERFELAEMRSDAHRKEGIGGHRWWNLEELETTNELTAPRTLGRALRLLLTEGFPPQPIDVGI